jgi:hypothetical protein
LTGIVLTGKACDGSPHDGNLRSRGLEGAQTANMSHNADCCSDRAAILPKAAIAGFPLLPRRPAVFSRRRHPSRNQRPDQPSESCPFEVKSPGARIGWLAAVSSGWVLPHRRGPEFIARWTSSIPCCGRSRRRECPGYDARRTCVGESADQPSHRGFCRADADACGLSLAKGNSPAAATPGGCRNSACVSPVRRRSPRTRSPPKRKLSLCILSRHLGPSVLQSDPSAPHPHNGAEPRRLALAPCSL